MQTIGILGAYEGAGATHLAINLAKSLQVEKYKTCIVDLSKTKQVQCLGEELELLDDDTEVFEYKGIDFVVKNVPVAQLRKEGYDFIIYDFGSDLSDRYYQTDIPILVASGRVWNLSRNELVEKMDILDEKVGLDTITFVFSFTGEKSKKNITKFTEGAKTIFTIIDDAFNPSFDLSLLDLVKEEKPSLLSSLRGKVDVAQIEKIKKENSNLKNSISSYTNQIKEKEKALKEKEHILKEKENKIIEIDNKIKAVEEEKTFEVAKMQEELATKDQHLINLDNQYNELSNKLNEKEVALSEKEQALLKREEELKAMEYTATHDNLTLVRNRVGFDKFVSENDLSGKYLVFIDINYLKAINDSKGHDKGNVLIKEVADTISGYYENIFRVGGDEFVVIAEDVNSLKSIEDDLKKKSTDDLYIEISYGYDVITNNDVISSKIKADENMLLDKAEKKKRYNPFSEYVDDRIVSKDGITRYTNEKNDTDEEVVEESIEEPIEQIEVVEEVVEEPIEEYEDGIVIPCTSFEAENINPFHKPLSSYWAFEYNLKYERDGKYNERKLYIYPTTVTKAFYTHPVIVAIETVDGYDLYSGMQIEIVINGIIFNYNSRFDKNGNFMVAITTEAENVKVIPSSAKKICGEYTPRNFGIKVELKKSNREIEIYPIKPNESGFCDAVLKLGDELEFSTGNESFEGKTYGLVFDTDEFILIGEE